MPAIIVKSLLLSCDLSDRKLLSAGIVPTQPIEMSGGKSPARQNLPGVSCRAGTAYAQRQPCLAAYSIHQPRLN
jgi:hypothetical protein